MPKFYGLYCVQSGGVNTRLVVMNNVLPRAMKMHYKYDLKGSTYKRRASRKEREKSSPTYKDLDFQDMHEEGLHFDHDTYSALTKTLQRDCQVSDWGLSNCLFLPPCILQGVTAQEVRAVVWQSRPGCVKSVPEQDT